MTDAAFPAPRAQTRLWWIEHFSEIAFVLIILLITVRVPQFSKFTTAAWLGVAALLAVARRTEVALVLLRWWPLLLAPLVAAVSFIWADVPSIALKYGLQLLATAFIGVLLARCLPPSKLVTALFLAMFAFCLMSIASDRQGISTQGAVWIGLVGSKNQMAFMGYLLAFSAFATAFNPLAPRLVRLMTLPGFAVGAYVVSITASATAVLMTAGCLAVFAALLVLQRLTPAGRVGIVFAVVAVASPIALLMPEIERGVTDFIINVLHKDPGLTGRDYLWARADELIAMKPILGHGFQTFWLGNSPESVALLRTAGIADPRSFNFHNTFRQFAVDTGFLGLSVLVATLAAALLAGLRQLAVRPTLATTFCFTFLVSNMARMHTEVLLVTFSVHTVLIFVCLTYAFWRPQPGWEEDPVYAPIDPHTNGRPTQAPAPLSPRYRLERHALQIPAPIADQAQGPTEGPPPGPTPGPAAGA
jgi:exopolysaccharide production protein ExoQ